ncbi:Uncharacterized conserved protein YgiB, involved in bioifilm formation, UPF0441/DUF1190 family [Pseudomonas koreensis]|uniref:DUF1190 domain-containing protein n=1 Tax=Pseudomonas koreensis TaxID=198620 RepID=UPI00087AE1EE|nr:DUF1190 domain-containing protein [Pseudomonas koreensis]KAB0511582.1 DUF1190 domain-containing protein [Pseudomonas koreensis]NNA64554.1 DUF1190 domain-containing protein [Pseudomonas koreensis]GGK41886.1 hypothetical protein GCM10009103_40950 [Pseudomonas koreensis]SDD67722.1 Uncharacterized conserved protein YgiB, involved in bioifilm formation, UPF0441/DUF1190 family [Pseudomonas koreensis]
MKRSKYVQLSLAASVALAISGEVAAQEQQRYQSVEECVGAEVAADVCSNAYVAALTEHRRIAPAYDDKAKCDADFAADWCQKNSDGRFMPKLGGFKVPQNGEAPQDLNAIANAQMPAGEAAAAQNAQSTSHSSGGGGGNGWLTGWLIGNAMSNNANRTVYRDRDTRQTYNTSTQYRKIESAPRSQPDYESSKSKPVNVASSTSRGGFGSQSSARSGWGGWGSSSGRSSS